MSNLNQMLVKAKDLAETEPDQALVIINDILNEELDTPLAQMALYMAGYIMMNAGRDGLAYNLYKRCAELNPDQSEIYSNMGMCVEVTRPKEAVQHFKKARELNPSNPNGWGNEGLIYLQSGDPDKCIKVSKKALALDPGLRSARHNIGLALLMKRDFKEGWRYYADTLGVKHREKRNYGVPDWDYKSPGTILVYGEQGVGDEIMFASCLRDLAKTNNIVLDTDKRLHSLFDRTFDFPVYGTRFESETPIRAEHEIDYQVAAGQLPHIYRNKESDFPGTPYLKPDPERQIMWRALFDTFKGKKIGIAWRGGIKNTHEAKRSMELKDLEPILNDKDTFVSLEYKPVNKEEIDKYQIKSYPSTTGAGQDIDDLAAMISQLDYVVTACTTVVYVAGALGVPCFVLTPSEPSYRYHIRGYFPWYRSVQLIRQKKGEKWRQVAKRAAKIIKERKC